MKEKRFAGGIYYFDVVAALIGVVLVLGHRLIAGGTDAAALIRDASGWWIPLLAAALLFVFRRRAYTQETPWVVSTVAALACVGLAAVFWRWNIMAFIAATLSGSLLLLAGLVLRRRRLSERLWRQDLFGLVAMVMGVLLTLAIMEGVLRAFPGAFSEEVQQMLQADPENYGIADPYIGHLHKPNNTIVLAGRDFKALHHVDGLGFRNTWPWADRAEIVVIGDSVTFGYGVADDQAWPYLVGQQASPLRVINLGLIGAGPQQYLRLFERFGVKLRPKLLLVGVFPQNDFWDADAFDTWLQSGVGGNYMVWRDFGRPRRVTFRLRDPLDSLEGVLRSTVVPAVRSSYFYTLLRAIRGGQEGTAPTPPRTISFADGSRLQLLESDFLAKSAAAQPDRREFQLLLDSLQQIDSLASRHGAHALIVLQPGKEQVYLPLLGETRGDPTGALLPALDRLGIDYLDLAPAFRARAARGERLFFEVDGHPNQAGYDLIAHLVIAHIMENSQRYGLEE
jgi:lysophospholipase L1-like esterase